MKKILTAFALASAFAAPAWAATQTVVLSVPGMTCVTCPLAIKTALSKVNGVSKAEVTFVPKQAVVTFDDTKTSVETLTKATADIGYPSELKK